MYLFTAMIIVITYIVLQKTTGIDLKMPVKGKRKKKQRKHPGLTDLKQSDNTAMTRLKKKIFKK